MKKLFGSINLTWKKLIVFAIITGVYTAIMALIPITKDTSFRDIAIMFEWWISFGIIIICNSKSPIDSALKCFVFFLISQPLIYLIQVPFSDMGWKLFGYYRYWFLWTILTIPMGFFGYYIKRKDFVSLLILSPMIVTLTLLGIGYINSAIESFPHHLLSGISCFAIITVVTLNLFDKKILRLISLGIVVVSAISIIKITGIGDSKYETYRDLNEFNITLVGKIEVSTFTGTREGNVEVINTSDEFRTIKISGWKNGEYSFTIIDEENNEYEFEYYFDKEQETVILKEKK